MKTFIKKLGNLSTAIEQEKGEEFVLFAVVLPEDAIAWDLLASASWIDKDRQSGVRYLVERIQSVLTNKEIHDLAGVLVFDTEEFESINSSMRSETGWTESEIEFYGRKIQKGYLFAAPVSDLQVFAQTVDT